LLTCNYFRIGADVLNNHKSRKNWFLFFRSICCLWLMKQISPHIHACTMDSVILMKWFEFIYALSRRLFGYFILFKFIFCFAVKNNLDGKVMKISCIDCFLFSFSLFLSLLISQIVSSLYQFYGLCKLIDFALQPNLICKCVYNQFFNFSFFIDWISYLILCLICQGFKGLFLVCENLGYILEKVYVCF
jgi:hypothetical protein